MSVRLQHRLVLRALATWCAVCVVTLVFAACGDDPVTPQQDADAVDADDTAVLIDTAAPDGASEDTAVVEDGAPLEDTAVVEDTALAEDTEDVEDTGDVEDTAQAEDTEVVEDTAVVEDTEKTEDTAIIEDTAVIEDTAPPVGPFDDLEDLSGPDLKVALLARISPHTNLVYDGDGLAREVMFAILDAHDGRLECIYTGRTIAAENPLAPPLGTASLPQIDTTPGVDCRWPEGNPVSGGCVFNAEHSWPRSKGADNEPAASDLHHLFPAYDMANNQRSNYPFGETTCTGSNCTWSEGESELGERADGTKVFQVRPKYRGDIARAQFYFAVRYSKSIDATVEATLRQWHAQDPPDDEERARNDTIETFQHNRNPFVDRPDFVSHIGDF